ncbi:hypothetical protein [Sinomonas humi]|uniref:hypothetical protein n=1 Tax=Sinomonas humi TaxID=1338436 RepID=UPI0012E0A7B5|nr:hypothetical protein [Sinomonas humi]
MSERRVRAMLGAGGIGGEKIGGRWIVTDLDRGAVERAPIRPLSPRACWILIDSADASRARAARVTSAVEKHRLGERLGRLQAAPDPLPLLRAWLVNRAVLRGLRASLEDLKDLRADSRLALSGVSPPEAGLLAGNEVEAYISAADLRDLVDDYLLVEPRPHSPANVVLHVVSAEGAESLAGHSVPLLAIAADLAERPGVREHDAARDLVRRILDDQSA